MSVAWGQLQQLQAQRNADQAEQRARSLQNMAQSAQREADQAQNNARTLRVDSTQARGEADTARRNLASMSGMNEVSKQLGELREQIGNALAEPVGESAAATSAPAPSRAPATTYTNAQGQATGSLVNVTA